MASCSSPCAACKYLRRKCTQECVFAPYFLPDNPRKFATVHRVFGAGNVKKLLNELSATDREAAVTSLAYEAECRLKDPVYGCVGHISILHQKLKDMQSLLINTKKELAMYIGPRALLPILQPPEFNQQQQPSKTITQPLGQSMTIPQPQPSWTIRQEHHVTMISEEQHVDKPSTPMFAYKHGSCYGCRGRDFTMEAD